MGMSKRFWVVLSVGIFSVGLVGFGQAYLNQVQQGKRLSEELTFVQTKTAGISTEKLLIQKSTDQDQLTQYESRIADAKEQLTAPLVVTDIFQRLLETANTTSTNMTMIGSSAVTDTIIGKSPCRSLSVDFAVAGDAKDIYRFVNVVSGTFATGALKTLGITIPNADDKSPGKSVANMKLTIYSYRGE